MTMQGPLPEPEVIIRKVKARHHGAHHGGAWKVAYADFVTAMMAFFLLMWLLGSTTEDQRRGIADYFTPALVEREQSGGSNGVLGGRSILDPEGASPHSKRSQVEKSMPPSDQERRQQLSELEMQVRQRLENDPGLNDMQGHLRFTDTPEGLRIELVDKADYSMFTTGTSAMDPRARQLLSVVADAIRAVPNRIAIRGHTDARPFGSSKGGASNWTLSSDRADATRQALAAAGVSNARFARLEGVAETEPLNPTDPFDPRNRRLSVTLLRD